jgi:sugar/nucleoside kinase (ribokinase family)
VKVLTIGGATQDIFIHYTDAFNMHLCNECGMQPYIILKSGAKIDVQDIHYATGGGATNSAVSFKRLGFQTTIFCKVGVDDQGNHIIQELKKESILTSPIIQTSKHATGCSFILPTPNQDRTILAYRGANSEIQINEIPMETIASQDMLYITSLSGNSSQLLLPITRLAKNQGVFVANNPGISQLRDGANSLRDALPYIDILILNADEATQLMLSLAQTDEALKKTLPQQKERYNYVPLLLSESLCIDTLCFNLDHFFKAVLKRGPGIVVVTNGAEGVYAATEQMLYFHPSFPVEIKHTSVGAGDAFGSCFAAMIKYGESLEDALRYGILNACSVIEHENAKTGLLTLNQLRTKITQVDKQLLQSFKELI